jgi:hypothetical protein
MAVVLLRTLIITITGEPEVNPVSVDDLIYLKNQWYVAQTYP